MAENKKEKSFSLNFDSINFKTNWATLTAIVGLLVFSVSLYVSNSNKAEKIDKLSEKVQGLERKSGYYDSILVEFDEYFFELIQKTNKFEEADMLVFYKDLYFENRFRVIDGKTYMEYIPDKTDFYMKDAPKTNVGNRPINLPPSVPIISSH